MFEEKICIVDDVFPHPRSVDTWRGIEFEAYLKEFRNLTIVTTLASSPLLGEEKPEEIMRDYYCLHPEYSERVIYSSINELDNFSDVDMMYFVFLNTVYCCVDFLERYNIPFTFELYPGGGFALNNEESDSKLERVMKSSLFRGVVVTNPVTKDYLLSKKLCDANKMLYIPGCVFNNDYKKITKTYYGNDKKTFDIAFAAYRYSKSGSDKGYDLFINVAKCLHKISNDFRFHVVGNFDDTVIDVKELEGYIHFYGVKDSKWFDSFYSQVDVFVSPNRSSILNNGAFDGFPTGCGVDAIIRKAVLIATDDLNQNRGQFQSGRDIFIIKPSVSIIVERILFLYKFPCFLEEIGNRGSDNARIRYSSDNQLLPRIEFLKEIMKSNKNDGRRVL